MWVVRNKILVNSESLDLFLYLPLRSSMRLELGVNLAYHDIDIYLRSAYNQQPSRLILSANSHLNAKFEQAGAVGMSVEQNKVGLVEFIDSTYNWPMIDVTMFNLKLNSQGQSDSSGEFLYNYGLVNLQNKRSSNENIELELINIIG